MIHSNDNEFKQTFYQL